MGERTDRALGRLLAANNERVRRADEPHPNPRPLDGVGWNEALVARTPAIRAEWDAFDAAGGRLPRLEQLLGEHQGNEGSWRAGIIVSRGRPAPPHAARFPATVAALGLVPGLRYALWSVLEPGLELPAHEGPNAGVLRYHLTVRSNPDAALSVGGTVVPYVEGSGILFDDTAEHAAWNRGEEPRVSILCELLRPVGGTARLANEAFQRLISLDPRYRRATDRAVALDAELNPSMSLPER